MEQMCKLLQRRESFIRKKKLRKAVLHLHLAAKLSPKPRGEFHLLKKGEKKRNHNPPLVSQPYLHTHPGNCQIQELESKHFICNVWGFDFFCISAIFKI